MVAAQHCAKSQGPADINVAIENRPIVADMKWDLTAQQPVMYNIGEIQQVLLHLIVNAAHAVAERVGNHDGREDIRIAMYEDNGASLSTTVHAHIIGPFFNAKEPYRLTYRARQVNQRFPNATHRRHSSNATDLTEQQGKVAQNSRSS